MGYKANQFDSFQNVWLLLKLYFKRTIAFFILIFFFYKHLFAQLFDIKHSSLK